MKRRLISWICVLLLCLTGTADASIMQEEGFPSEMPYWLQLQQTTTKETLYENVQIRRTVPTTNNPEVDALVAETVERLVNANREKLPTKKQSMLHDLDVGSVVYRTGSSWMSFLTIASLDQERVQTAVDYECHAYEMESGRELQLTDVFPSDSEVWEWIRQRVREELNAYFPSEEADQAALEALLTTEALQQADFTMGVARIMLTWRADLLYPGRASLMHVFLNYSDVQQYMTEEALKQTDNSGIRVVAFTFDDGPSEKTSRLVMNELRLWGAQGTFFCVGFRLLTSPFIVNREHDAGYTVASHTWYHDTKDGGKPAVWLEEQQRFDEKLCDLIGLPASLIRAPGGKDKKVYLAGIELPIIHWSLASGDATGQGDTESWADRVKWSLRDGDIVLLHDLSDKCGAELRILLPQMEQYGVLCVTVDELYAHNQMELEPRKVYYGVHRDVIDYAAEN